VIGTARPDGTPWPDASDAPRWVPEAVCAATLIVTVWLAPAASVNEVGVCVKNAPLRDSVTVVAASPMFVRA
jgi:hypothetical protein